MFQPPQTLTDTPSPGLHTPQPRPPILTTTNTLRPPSHGSPSADHGHHDDNSDSGRGSDLTSSADDEGPPSNGIQGDEGLPSSSIQGDEGLPNSSIQGDEELPSNGLQGAESPESDSLGSDHVSTSTSSTSLEHEQEKQGTTTSTEQGNRSAPVDDQGTKLVAEQGTAAAEKLGSDLSDGTVQRTKTAPESEQEISSPTRAEQDTKTMSETAEVSETLKKNCDINETIVDDVVNQATSTSTVSDSPEEENGTRASPIVEEPSEGFSQADSSLPEAPRARLVLDKPPSDARFSFYLSPSTREGSCNPSTRRYRDLGPEPLALSSDLNYVAMVWRNDRKHPPGVIVQSKDTVGDRKNSAQIYAGNLPI